MAKTNKTKQDNQDKLLLSVTQRTIFGKKLRKLRKEGIIPANIYGPDFKSQSVSIPFKDFIKVYKVAKETGVVYIKIGDLEIPVLIKNVQRHPVKDHILHADLRKIDLKQKIQTDVPIKILGQSEAVIQKAGVLLTQNESLLIEALPTYIPKQIEVDISSLKEIGQEIKVSDLPKSNKYEIKDPLDKIIVSIVEHKEEEILPQTAPVSTPEVITAKPEEGTEPTEKAAKTPETKAKTPETKTPDEEAKKPEQPKKS